MAPDQVRAAFAEAAAAFDGLVATIADDQLEAPATDRWTVRELVGHTARALGTIEQTLATPVDPSTRHLDSPAAYFRAAMVTPGVHEGIVDRGRAAGVELGDDPAARVHDAVVRVTALVDRTGDDVVVQHFAGRIAFRDYLQTRTLELVLHGVDLQLALGRRVEAPPSAAAQTRDLLVALVDLADPLAVACALSGRGAAVSCNVLS